MEQFYKTLGMALNDQSSSPVWREMEASGGVVALHPLQQDGTDSHHIELSFETSRRLEDIQWDLEKAGFESGKIYDEEYGRYLSIEDPEKMLLRINEVWRS
ncbi:hypothetical protein NSA19_13440 [Actinomyces bowdenii]|uniref:hypothetical protein n=1 Tax=Actinomyces bowdenii TaxID=131109 RepID=UPI00214C76B1|nr:hypothetical protein [Actinomyces bowdenii]MCR2053821.1 hypothetical protein [Actinomyces bowdenii]